MVLFPPLHSYTNEPSSSVDLAGDYTDITYLGVHNVSNVSFQTISYFLCDL